MRRFSRRPANAFLSPRLLSEPLGENGGCVRPVVPEGRTAAILKSQDIGPDCQEDARPLSNSPSIEVLVVTSVEALYQRIVGGFDLQPSQIQQATDIPSAVELLQRAQARVLLVDVDCCQGSLEDMLQQLRNEAPNCFLVPIVGWWDARSTELRSLCDEFVYNPISKKQLREVLDTSRTSTAAPEPLPLPLPAAKRLAVTASSPSILPFPVGGRKKKSPGQRSLGVPPILSAPAG